MTEKINRKKSETVITIVGTIFIVFAFGYYEYTNIQKRSERTSQKVQLEQSANVFVENQKIKTNVILKDG